MQTRAGGSKFPAWLLVSTQEGSVPPAGASWGLASLCEVQVTLGKTMARTTLAGLLSPPVLLPASCIHIFCNASFKDVCAQVGGGGGLNKMWDRSWERDRAGIAHPAHHYLPWGSDHLKSALYRRSTWLPHGPRKEATP